MGKAYRPFNANFVCDPELPWEANLAAAIVNRAIADARIIQHGRGGFSEKYNSIDKWEIVNFFRSSWCADLLGCTELTGRDILD